MIPQFAHRTGIEPMRISLAAETVYCSFSGCFVNNILFKFLLTIHLAV